MPDTVIESVLKGKLESDLLIKWLTNEATEDLPEDCILCCCSRSEFAACFLSYLRNQTDSILQTNSNALQILQQNTPEKLFNSNRKHRRSISDPTSETHHMDSLSVKSDHQKSQESPNREKKKGKKVKTKLFADNSMSSDDSRLSSGVDRMLISSTPIKNGLKADYPTCFTSPVTPTRHFKEQERCDTPRLNHRYSRSSDKSVSLGDYLATAQKSSKKKKKNSSNDDSKILNSSNSDCKTLDPSNADSIWNSEFPVIGARKSNSLKSEKRRIKPTSIEKQKSFSLNSFNAECFQQTSPGVEENSAFKHQKIQSKPHETNSFEAERNILKQERHKLMEKFNILNTATTPKAVTPQIKIMKRDSVEKPQSYIEADVLKVSYKEKLDTLIVIYEVLLKNNLVLSFTAEIYFLISILLSKQVEDDFLNAEQELNSKENIPNFLLKSIHNSSYFAVKSLWNQRSVLELILDKNALKILGENRKVRSFFPDLAKFLLNSYGLKCEAESVEKCKSILENRCNGIVCFNMETDNAENFSSLLSFQNFKKQRDMFYEILRWYGTCHQTSGFSRSTFRGRIKTLICTGSSADNHKHLATLFLSQMKVDCLMVGTQESKLSKLQRRLTTPTVADTHRLPTFTEKETFYKEFIMYTDNEAFRTHLRDAIASEMVEQDAKPICNNDDRSHNSNTLDLQKEFLQVSKKLRLLSKFLGLLASLPYSQVPIEVTLKMGSSRDTQRENIYATPKEKVLETNIALRKYIQPCIDLKGILRNATKSGRLCVTVPWIVHYLSMLDYTSLRIDYTQQIIGQLFDVYVNRLRVSEKRIRRTTVVFLKIILGWLFSLPHFPQELFHDRSPRCDVVSSEMIIDNCDLIDECVLFDLCPFLKDINVLLSVCCVIGDKETTFRHITPVSLNVNAEDRIKNKEKELQSRLEEEFLKSQPSSTRRVLEVVIERVTSGCVRELSVHSLHEARRSAREQAAKIVRNGNDDQAALLKTLEALYNDQLMQLRENALSNATNSIKKRTASALSALLPSAPKPLQAVAAKGCINRLTKWLNDNWNSTAILCKNLEEELSSLISLEMRLNCEPLTVQNAPTAVVNAETLVSAAESIVRLKEAVCQLLDYEEPSDLATILSNCAISCSPGNVFSRPPTKRAILQLSVDLAIVYVSRRPKEVNDRFLQRLDSVWNVCCPDRRTTRSTSRQSPELVLERPRTPKTPDRDESSSEVTEESELLEFFDRILCARNIVLLSDSKCGHSDVWNSVATVLVFCLRNNYLSEDSLTEQCLAVYRQDWPQGILENLSQCMKSVSTRWSTSSAGKFNLFLDFLAEYCGDMDYEPLD